MFTHLSFELIIKSQGQSSIKWSKLSVKKKRVNCPESNLENGTFQCWSHKSWMCSKYSLQLAAMQVNNFHIFCRLLLICMQTADKCNMTKHFLASLCWQGSFEHTIKQQPVAQWPARGCVFFFSALNLPWISKYQPERL